MNDAWKGVKRLRQDTSNGTPHRLFKVFGVEIFITMMISDGHPVWRSQRDWNHFEKLSLPHEVVYGTGPSGYGKTLRQAVSDLRINIMKMKNPALIVVDNLIRHGKQ